MSENRSWGTLIVRIAALITAMTGIWDWDISGSSDINPKPTTDLPEGEQPKPSEQPKP